jgi:hypothetical protein
MAVTRTVVGRYEIRKEIGRGGTATVYLACQTDLRRPVALKELSAFSAAEPGFARRFVRESQLSASLSHPSLVTVHDYFEADGLPFIAMEYLPSGSLRSRVGALSLGQVAGMLESMLGGLVHAHARKIVHRDLKPENVLVTEDGSVKIADFGIAKALDSVETKVTVTGTTIGTPAYMAPEQALAGEIGAWTDLYSVGIVAFELIAGATPFGDAEPVAILLRHIKDKPPPLTRAAPGTARPVSDWVARLLEKEPEDRPGSAAEAWESLEEIVLSTLGPRWRRDARLPAAEPTRPARARTPPTQPMDTAAGAGVASAAAGEDSRLLDTVTPRFPVEPPAVPAAPRAAARARRPFWQVAVAVIVLGWAIAALLLGALSGPGGGQSPASPSAQPAATTTTPTAPAETPTTATPTETPTATPAATATPRPQHEAGAGDSQSDDPSDDAPGSEDDPEADGPDP